MALIKFTENYEDLSTDRGFQFKFFCDHCHNGYLTTFKPSVLGMAGGLLSAAGNLFGGMFHSAGETAYDVQRAVGGPAHDEALRDAVAEAMPHFKQCTRCGRWVCPEHCWNHQRNLCESCAPDESEELAAAQAQVTRDQIWQRAQEADLARNIDVTTPAAVFCPQCGAKAKGKFCNQCGARLAANLKCRGCGRELEPGSRFCAECGTPTR
jgi:hypothetical protein